MIFDNAKNLDYYRSLGIGDRYAKAIDWLKSQDLAALENGKYEIDGKLVYANVMSYTTLPWEDAKYEAHEDYTDIQYMIKGRETLTYAPIDALNPTGPYNPEKDVILYDNSNPGLKITASDDEFLIFNPWDGHKPKAMADAPCEVKKVVVKICEK